MHIKDVGLGWAGAVLVLLAGGEGIKADDIQEPVEALAKARAAIDAHGSESYGVEPGHGFVPAQVRPLQRRGISPRAIKVVEVSGPVEGWELWRPDPVRVRNLAFRAPLFGSGFGGGEDMRSGPARAVGEEKQLLAVECVKEQLASDGLLAVSARVLELLGPEQFLECDDEDVAKLEEVGLPVDWLGHFHFGGVRAGDGPEAMIEAMASMVAGGGLGGWGVELKEAVFDFQKTQARFQAAEESGEQEVGGVRVQIGGGYEGGIVPGDTIDLATQAAVVFSDAQFLVSAPAALLEPLMELVGSAWPIRRAEQVTLWSTPAVPSSWPQDNGKAGLLAGGGSGGQAEVGRWATLAPRFASQGEVETRYLPMDSLVMEGLAASGHTVVHSPLLFQGGNLLVARDPQRNERVVLLSETEIYRNQQLGLKRAEIVQAFVRELGTDRCEVMPAVSYHLDYDVTVRVVNGELAAFVNDPTAAARLLVEHGLSALELVEGQVRELARAARLELSAGAESAAIQRVRQLLELLRTEDGIYQGGVLAFFRSHPQDDPEYNFQCFLTAVDWLEAQVLEVSVLADSGMAGDYLDALRRMERESERQQEQLRQAGWRVCPVPSMPDLYRSWNYLNGVQTEGSYAMPVFGGFFGSLDAAATAAFREVLGKEVRIVKIRSAGSQRQHGAVHCALSVYPRLKEKRGRSGS